MQKKTENSISSILRDKYISTSLNDSLKLNTRYPLFSKLGGVGYLRKDIVDYIYNPLFKKAEYSNIGISPPKTLLLYGVSGVGKTFIVNCISQEYKIPIINGGYDSDKEIREVFRRGELNEHSIILFDKIDLLDPENDKKVINQLSKSLDCYEGKSIVIGISEKLLNIPQQLRKFDNEVLIKIPNDEERKEIFIFNAQNVKHTIRDWNVIARMTPGYLPRDFKKLFKITASVVVSKGRGIVSYEDILEGIHDMKKQSRSVTFDNIGSLENVKEELEMSIILPSRYPHKFRKLGILKPSGVLLHGPPGCGKTLLARAVSNMSHCNFISVKGPELISKYVGDSEGALRSLFDKAKQLQPCVVFFDEIDSLCSKRKHNGFENRIVNQILTLLDGLEDRGEVYIIGATNRLSSLDRALLRSGRFDKVIEVPFPDKNGCIDILKKYVINLPLENFDYEDLPLKGFSGADIAGIVKEAGVICLKKNFDLDNPVISKKDFEEAIIKLKNMKN